MKYGYVVLCLVVGLVVFTEGAGHLNDKCRERNDCSRFGYYCSKNFTCQCLKPSYMSNKYGDKCVGIIGIKCKYDEHCIEGAYCKEQEICKCKEDYVPSEDNTECSVASYSEGTLVVPSIVFIGLVVLGLGT